jgi:hypothetical protein
VVEIERGGSAVNLRCKLENVVEGMTSADVEHNCSLIRDKALSVQYSCLFHREERLTLTNTDCVTT